MGTRTPFFVLLIVAVALAWDPCSYTNYSMDNFVHPNENPNETTDTSLMRLPSRPSLNALTPPCKRLTGTLMNMGHWQRLTNGEVRRL